MIIVDVNLLLYAMNRDAPLHAKAKAWWQSVLNGAETVGIPWNVVLAFLRLTTKAGAFGKPLPPDQAFDVVAKWLECPQVSIVDPGSEHLETLRRLIVPLGTAGNLTSDAHIAAIAIGLNAQLCSSDSDFARFSGLNWKNPLT
jgi:toxin-antitoxin system PIN domain toxin